MEEFLNIEIEIVEVLLIVTLVAMVARRIRLPYTVALVLAGLLIALQNELRIELTPELVLALFLPPLVFEAAFHLRLGQLRANLTPILTLAIPGVLLSTALVGILLSLFGILPLPAALLFGALIAATDPVAVIAVFRAVGAPKQLTVLVEGESLFNDGTAIVVFHIMLAYVLEGTLSPLEGVVDFFIVSLGGVAIGLILGYGTAELIARIDDYLIEITLTTVAAYGSYLIAESFHMSGVLAVVMAGLVIGNVGPRGMSPTTRIVLINFWEYLAFLANSFVFILIGMNVEYDELLQFAGSALVAVVVVLMVRAVTVYGLGSILQGVRRGVDRAHLHVMIWGGLRGAVSLALVLSIPLQVVERRQLLAMSFGVVLFTLLAQATTIPMVLARLGLTSKKATPLEYERIQGQLLATRSAGRHIDHLYQEGALLPVAWETVKEEVDQRQEELSDRLRELLGEHPGLRDQVISLARIEVLRAQRAALDELARAGLLSDEALSELEAEIDAKLEAPHDDEVADIEIPA
ncbi:MAG TPA: Na+/H+ antiporter [Caldilineaceae bacterium]|nr:Na+/H+ antiporter [Caldilineaceae bacterium]